MSSAGILTILTATLMGCAAAIGSRPDSDRSATLLVHLIADADSAREPTREAAQFDPPRADTPVDIDPRPLRRAEESADATEPWFAAVGADVVQRRAALITSIGADTAHTASFDKCPRRGLSEGVQPGCPRTAELVVAFGRLAPSRPVQDTTAQIVRVQWFELAPRGQRSWEYRYLVRWADGRWQTLERRVIGFIG